MSRHVLLDEMWGTPARRQILVSEQSLEAFVAELEKRMRPGHSSEAGFLGPSERLLHRLQTDDEWLRRHEITHEQIADRLETVIGVARRWWTLADMPRTFIVYDRFEVEISSSLGFQECPLSLAMRPGRTIEWCGAGSCDYLIRDRVTGRSLFVPHLAIHLIHDHHFFEGETPYRVEPATVTELLEIRPGVQYAPRTVNEPVWQMVESTSEIDEERVVEIANSAESRVEFGSIEAYRVGGELVLVVREAPSAGTVPPVDGIRIHALWLRAGISRFQRLMETYNVETPWMGTRPPRPRGATGRRSRAGGTRR